MFCSKCGAPQDDKVKFCAKCGAPATGTELVEEKRMRGVSEPKPQTGKRYAAGKNPTLATVLSILIVGVGQFYNGDVKKGLIMLGGAVVGGLFTYGIAWLGVAVWSAFDAYQVAAGKSHLW